MTSRIRLAALAALITSLAACGGDSPLGGPDPIEPGAGLRFTYEGERTGAYGSAGAPSITQAGVPGFGEWAVARPDSVGGMVLVGFQPTTAPRGDFFILQLHPSATGEFACSEHGIGGCHGRFFMGVNTQDLSAVPTAAYDITTGSVTITELTATRVRGTFKVTLKNRSGPGTIRVNDGVIDIPFASDLTMSNGVNCWARNVQQGTNEPCGS